MFAETIKKNYTVVKSYSEFRQALHSLKKHKYISFDTETTGLNVRKEKVIGFSFCGTEGEAFYIPHLSWNKEKMELEQIWSKSDCLEFLNVIKNKSILTWNGSFDVRIVKNYFGIDLTRNIEADGMLLQHTISEEGPFALKECAIIHQVKLGLDVQSAANEEQLALKQNVMENGGTTTRGNFEMYKADLWILGEYACADADLTFRLCNYLNERVYEESLDKLFYETEVMPLYKYVTIPMEDRGVKVDVPLLEKSTAEIKIEIEKHKTKVIDALKKTKEFQSWLENTAAKNYPPSPRGKFGNAVNEFFGLGLTKVLKKEVESLPESDYKQFLLTGAIRGTKLEQLMTGTEAGLTRKDVLKVQLHLLQKETPELININSKSQLGDLVFNYLNVKHVTTTKKGAPQFNDDFIETIQDLYPWASVLSDYNKLVKIKSSYFNRIYEMLEGEFVYFNFKQHGTISGRYSSDAQQFPRPKEEGELSPTVLYFNNIVRALFISDHGRVFIDDDYESLEPHVFSHVSGDERIQEIFHKGWDFYSTIAIKTEKLEGVSADKKADNYLGKLNKPKRQSAKAYSLGVPYGMTGYALAKSLGISTEEGEALVEAYLSAFPDLAKWMQDSRDFVKAFGYIKTQSGRVRHLPRVKELYAIHGDKLLDFRYRKSLEKRLGAEVVLNMYRDYKNGLNNALNFQIQGLSASIINLAMIAMSKEFEAKGIDAYVALSVHDQVIADSEYEKKEEAAKIVQTTMENSVKLAVALKAKPQFATNLRDGH